ncbi:MAG: TrbI/VirB10 family protein [Hyphomonadaceae bacterium]
MAETSASLSGPGRNEGEPPPPPLTDIRVRPAGSRGLNKKAILIAAGGAGAVVLGLASLNFSSDASRKPSAPAPMMSAPARPEMAKGAVGGLPANYEQAAEFERARQLPAPPQLGPALPGDVAAFAPEPLPNWRQEADEDVGFAGGVEKEPDPAVVEAKQADRSGLFFAVRAPSPAAISTSAMPRIEAPVVVAAKGLVTPASIANAGTERALFPGAVIPASLVTAINSEAPGPVIAQVSQTVYDSRTGRIVLIPQGARLVGDYRSATRYGQNRIVILWSRLVMPDGTEIAINELGSDTSGAAAIPGSVDDHWGDLFGAAALGTAINIGVASTEEPQIAYNGIGASTRDPVDQAVAEGIQRSASSVTSRVVDRSLALPPTIRVEAGKRIAVMVSRRLEF